MGELGLGSCAVGERCGERSVDGWLSVSRDDVSCDDVSRDDEFVRAAAARAAAVVVSTAEPVAEWEVAECEVAVVGWGLRPSSAKRSGVSAAVVGKLTAVRLWCSEARPGGGARLKASRRCLAECEGMLVRRRCETVCNGKNGYGM